MTVRYIGETTPLALTNGKLYEVLSIEAGDPGWYRIIDDSMEEKLRVLHRLNPNHKSTLRYATQIPSIE